MDADLRAAIDRALDAREDPLEDHVVQEHLLEHPENLELVERLLARLGALRVEVAEAEAEVRRWGAGRVGQRARRVAAAIAALVLFGACLWIARESARTAGERAGQLAAHEPAAPQADASRAERTHGEPALAEAPRLRVLDWRMTSTVTGPAGTRRVTTSPAGRRTSVESPTDPHRTLFARSETWSRP